MRHGCQHFALAALTTMAVAAVGACGLETFLGTPIPPKGELISGSFWRAFNPDWMTGMKWTYSMSGTCTGSVGVCRSLPETPGEVIAEVTNVEDEAVTIRSTSGTTFSTRRFSKEESMLQNSSGSISFLSEGRESVKVPAGHYETAKVRVDQGAESGETSVVWYAKGVGMVKMQATRSSGEATISTKLELMGFEKP